MYIFAIKRLIKDIIIEIYEDVKQYLSLFAALETKTNNLLRARLIAVGRNFLRIPFMFQKRLLGLYHAHTQTKCCSCCMLLFQECIDDVLRVKLKFDKA